MLLTGAKMMIILRRINANKLFIGLENSRDWSFETKTKTATNVGSRDQDRSLQWYSCHKETPMPRQHDKCTVPMADHVIPGARYLIESAVDAVSSFHWTEMMCPALNVFHQMSSTPSNIGASSPNVNVPMTSSYTGNGSQNSGNWAPR